MQLITSTPKKITSKTVDVFMRYRAEHIKHLLQSGHEYERNTVSVNIFAARSSAFSV